MRKMVLFALLIAATSAAKGLSKLEVAVIGATAADIITTEININKGFAEVNPLMQNRGVRFAGNAAHVVLTIWISRWLDRQGNDKLAKVLLVVPIAVHVTATGWNTHLSISW